MTQHTLQWPLPKLKAKNCAQEMGVQKYLGDEKESSAGRMRAFNLSEILVPPKPWQNFSWLLTPTLPWVKFRNNDLVPYRLVFSAP